MFKPRIYQTEISDKAVTILKKLNIVVFAIQVRVGKTFMALMTAEKMNLDNVLFVTKKKAISSIQNDYNVLNPKYNITIINYESLHKLPKISYDLIVIDESHCISAYPKPSKRAKNLKSIIKNSYLILMSGTMTPESYSQVFHQFWVSNNSPFKHSNFYKWAKDFVNVQVRHLGYAQVNDYSEANFKLIKPIIEPYIITFTQAKAGFKTNVKETVLHCDMKASTLQLIKRLKNDLIVEGKEEVILADTAVKLQSKIHQISSGTIKFESGNSKVLDYSKVEFIKQYFKGKKIAIFYKFKEELNALKHLFKDKLTTELNEFNTTDKNIALQFVSGREGISLKMAVCLVAFNIDFSATTYFQFKDRLTTKERTENHLYWIFANGGIEEHIYRAVQNKKSYTLNIFKKDYGI